MCISRIVEEIVPFWHYKRNTRRQEQKCGAEDILLLEQYANYQTLSKQQLKRRLKEEHQRASAIDEKTFKSTLSFSVGLTVLGLGSAILANTVSSVLFKILLTAMMGIGVLYFLGAGVVALGSLRTAQSFGYGTHFLLELKENTNEKLADSLARQETMNIIRHLRNETAYQALRNGLWLLVAGIVTFVVSHVWQLLLALPKDCLAGLP